jgi:hypothetical protein
VRHGRLSRALPYVAAAAIVVGFVNFFALLIASETIYRTDPATSDWARVHGASVVLTHPLAMAGMAYLLFRFTFPGMMSGRLTQEASSDRARSIRASGALIAGDRSAAKLGDLNLSGPMLRISVYPGGVVIKPAFMRERTILRTEIRSVTAKHGLLGSKVEIVHAGADVGSPVILTGSPDRPIVRAMRAIHAKPRGTPDVVAPASSIVPRSERHDGDMPRGITPVLNVLGVAVGIVLIVIILIFSPPQAGPTRFVFVGIVLLIMLFNIRRLVVRR